MSMYDRSWCATRCDRKNCERNLGFHKPRSRVYTASELDAECDNTKHIRCPYFSPIDEEEDE